ncbi:zinc finger protein 84-like [Cydia fagiglandana]|uniref:zinc finger protein 84-like n=1 Tax=Cydia fagiglandana TaxID=1458189 RepID=UPI002FEE6456
MSEGIDIVQVKVEPLYTDNEENVETTRKAEKNEQIHKYVKKEPIWNTEDCSPARLCRDQIIEKDYVSHISRKMDHIRHEVKKETEQNHTEDSQIDWCIDNVVKVERDVGIPEGSMVASQVSEHTRNTPPVQSKESQAACTDHGIKKENVSTIDANSSSICEATTPSGLSIYHVVKIEREDMDSANNVTQHKLNESESKVKHDRQRGHDTQDEKATIQSGLSIDQMVKADSSVIGLYMDHVVKDELVVGPEVLQRPKLLPLQSTINHIGSEILGRSCSVRLEKMHVDVESGVCRVDLNTHKFRMCPINYQDNFVKNEISGSTPQKDENKHMGTNSKSLSNKSIKVQEKRYKCDLCNYSTDEKYRLKVHGKVHSGEKPFKCKLCSYSTAYKAHLQIHDRIHTGERPYKCDQCSYASIQKCDLSVHKRVHSGEKPHKCSHCIFACKRKRDLLAHERTHKVEKPFKCEHCDYSSNRKRDLLIHVSRTHSLKTTINDQNTYKCDHCSYTSPSRRNWKNHIRIMHMKIKPYKCGQCDYETRDKIRFGTHVKKHTGEPIQLHYKCSQCKYATNHKHHMLGHQRTHSGEKPFKCGHCSYATAYRRELLAHKALHNDENPYKCLKCPYACGSESNLRNHERTHIGESANRLTETQKPICSKQS